VDLGGLSLYELAKRTLRASWRDAVFGQGSRMAFYHFLAIFPAMLLFLVLAIHLAPTGIPLRDTLLDFVRQVLPKEASSMFQEVLEELRQRALSGGQLVPAFCGAAWAACNGMWALMSGLNAAYEVQERRPWWKLAITLGGLTIALALAGSISMFLIAFGSQVATRLSGEHLPAIHVSLRVLQWVVIVALLMFSFALLYRFAPNLQNHKWRWSTPGALFALLCWVGSTIVVRFYFEHVSDYSRTYGHLNRVVMLLLWLYVSNGAILIGGEMNSEIEKAGGQSDADSQQQPVGQGHSGDRSGS
jgi:membrane protein